MTSAHTVLVTGAARGLGKALVEEYGDRGWKVLAPDRSALDVTDPASIEVYARSLEGQPIDVLINNAGIRLVNGADRLGSHTQEAWLRTLTVNAVGPVLVTQALLPNLLAGKGRKVVSMSSRLGSLAAGGGSNSGGSEASYSAYRVSKTALNQVNCCLASELTGDGFACVVLSPGWVRTDMGGAGARNKPGTVAADIADLVDRIDQSNNGAFMDCKGEVVPW